MPTDTIENESSQNDFAPEPADFEPCIDCESNDVSQNTILPDSVDQQPCRRPNGVYDIDYIGKSCFTRCECVVLIAKVRYCGGNGSGIRVEFKIGGHEFKTRTLEGGVAYVVLGPLDIGEYHGRVCAGAHSDGFTFIVGTCMFDERP